MICGSVGYLFICIIISGDTLPKIRCLGNLFDFLTYMHVYAGEGRAFILLCS